MATGSAAQVSTKEGRVRDAHKPAAVELAIWSNMLGINKPAPLLLLLLLSCVVLSSSSSVRPAGLIA